MKVQLCLVALALSILRGTYSQLMPIQGNCSEENHDGDLRLVHKQGDNFGALQVCDAGFGWRYFSRQSWTERAARLACMQLGLPHQDPVSNTLRLSENVFIRTVNGLCVETAQRLTNCIRNPFQTRNTVLTVNCTNGDLPREECTTNPVDINMAECTALCQSRSEACAAEINETLLLITTVAPRECPTQPPFTPKLNDIGTTEQTVSLVTMLGLGAFTGLATAALMGVIVGWIITCAYYKWKKHLAEHTASQPPTQAPQPHTDDTYDYINKIRATPTVSCDLTSNEAYHSVQCVTNDSYSVVP